MIEMKDDIRKEKVWVSVVITLLITVSMNIVVAEENDVLVVQMHIEKPALISAQKTNITISVYNSSMVSVPNATIKMSTDHGSFNVSTGLTGSTGMFYCEFIAPKVSTKTVCNITANASKSGFKPNYTFDYITVYPCTPLLIQFYADSTSVNSSGNLTFTVHVTNMTSGVGVKDAKVKLTASLGKLNKTEGFTNTLGNFVVNYTAPYVTTPTKCRISAIASKPNYYNASGYFEILIMPPEKLRVWVGVDPDNIHSGGTVKVNVYVSNSTNAPIFYAKLNLTSDSNGIFENSTGYTKPNGAFSTTFTAPIFPNDRVVNISVRASREGFLEGKGNTTLLVYGKAKIFGILQVKPSSMSSGSTASVGVCAKDYEGSPISNVAVTLSATIGNLSQSSGYTQSNGWFGTTYYAPIVNKPIIGKITAYLSKPGLEGTTKIQNITISPALNVVIISSPTIIPEGGESLIKVDVTDGINPIENANVKLNSSAGVLTPDNGKTDKNGVFTSKFKAPMINQSQIVCTIFCKVSVQGYPERNATTQVTVKKTGLPVLLIEIIPEPIVIPSGGKCKITVTTKNSTSGAPVAGADIMVESYGKIGKFTDPGPTGSTDKDGKFSCIFNAPVVSVHTVCILNASGVKLGYVSGFAQTSVSIKVIELIRLVVKVKPSSSVVVSESSTTITVDITDNQNTRVSGVTLRFNSSIGSCSVYEEISNGTYRCMYFAPVVLKPTECIINVTASKLNYITGYGECKISVYPRANEIPLCVIQKPKDGENVKGLYIIEGTAYDHDGDVIRVELNITGEWVNATGTKSWRYNWNTTQVPNGKYTIYARAFDGYNYSQIVNVSISVKNERPADQIPLEHRSFIVILVGMVIGFFVGLLIIVLRKRFKVKAPKKKVVVKEEEEEEEITPLPTCRILSPATHESVSDVYEVRGTAEPVDNPIKKVEVKIDEGPWIQAKGTVSWSYSWETTDFKDGRHRIYVRAYDGKKYSNIVMREVSVENWS